MNITDHVVVAGSAWFGGLCAQIVMWPFIKKHLMRIWNAISEIREHTNLSNSKVTPPPFNLSFEEVTKP